MNKRHENIIELQSIRGIAAIVVVASHCFAYFRTPDWFLRLQEVNNSHVAVVIFFVLSGFVLTNSLRTSDFSSTEVMDFYVKRVFRIYPAVFVSSAVALVYVFLIHPHLDLTLSSDWFLARFKSERYDPFFVFASFLGVSAFLLPQIWTVAVEVFASLFIPFIAYAAFRNRQLFYLVLVATVVLSISIGNQLPYRVGMYLVDFMLGSLIGIIVANPGRVDAGHKPAVSAILTVSIAAALLIRWLFWPMARTDIFGHAVEAIACFVLIYLVAAGQWRPQFLRNPTMVWMGDISFSVYLFHFPIMCLVAPMLVAVWPQVGNPAEAIPLAFALATVTILLTILVSWGTYSFVELPAIRFGRALVRRNGEQRIRSQATKTL